MSISDFKAIQKWNTIPEEFQNRLLNNVFCSSCGVTTIVKYSIELIKKDLLLQGTCKKCGKDVARIVEG